MKSLRNFWYLFYHSSLYSVPVFFWCKGLAADGQEANGRGQPLQVKRCCEKFAFGVWRLTTICESPRDIGLCSAASRSILYSNIEFITRLIQVCCTQCARVTFTQKILKSSI